LYEVALKHQKSKSIIRVHFVMLAFDNNWQYKYNQQSS
jgi:hypothetical protein